VPGADANRSYTVEFVETDTVGGREAYVLDIVPETNRSEAGYRQRLWLDTERFYPLRKQTAWTADGTRRSVTTTYTNVTFDAAVSADTFRPDIDAGTTVERQETPNTSWFRSRADLVARSSISVPEPTVPSAYELVYATRTTGRIDGVGLRYAAGRPRTHGREVQLHPRHRRRRARRDGRRPAGDYRLRTDHLGVVELRRLRVHRPRDRRRDGPPRRSRSLGRLSRLKTGEFLGQKLAPVLYGLTARRSNCDGPRRTDAGLPSRAVPDCAL
ncbi:hypothetical protein D320_20459, partial [Haloferax sp. BAB-2207]